MRPRAPILVMALAILAGCRGAAITAAEAGGQPPFPECTAESYAFVGESSLAALGLEEMWREQAGRVGEIWITAGPPDPAAMPQPPGPRGPDEPPPEQRHICLEFDDGSGMSGPIDDAWQPPGGGTFELAAAGDTPWAAVILPLAVVLVAIASVLAFRTASPPD